MSFRIEGISKSYGDIQALRNISFQTEANEIFGLIGPDGAGKTTLFRILVTLLQADKGEAYVGGYNVREDYRQIRKIIGYMPGRFSLYQDLSVKENLAFYAKVFGTSIEENYELVKDIYSHIEPFEDRLAGKLSGGMKQKLALSCALIHRPEVLILDEPTTGVDAVSRKEFWDMLYKIRDEGIPILVSTPYMDEAALCDRVGLIQKGQLMSVQHPDYLKFEDGTELFKFTTDGDIYKYLKKLRSIDTAISGWLFGDEIHVFSPDSEKSSVLQREYNTWQDHKNVLLRVKPGVEDYFLYLMSKHSN